jgi:hypothetical protein
MFLPGNALKKKGFLEVKPILTYNDWTKRCISGEILQQDFQNLFPKADLYDIIPLKLYTNIRFWKGTLE